MTESAKSVHLSRVGSFIELYLFCIGLIVMVLFCLYFVTVHLSNVDSLFWVPSVIFLLPFSFLLL